MGGCIAMVAILTVLQLTLATPPPAFLYLVFVAVWLFGFLMLQKAPVFGALGTASYGIFLTIQLFVMHGASGANLLIGAGSLATAGLALWFLKQYREEAALR